MKTVFVLIIGIFSFFSNVAQSSDLLILKKNGHTLKTFFPGDEIIFNTSTRYYDAFIQRINHDSIFLIQYDVKQVPTSLGIYILDTLGKYPFAVNYKEIIGFGKIFRQKIRLGRFWWRFAWRRRSADNSRVRNMDFYKTKYSILCKPISCRRCSLAGRHWLSSGKI